MGNGMKILLVLILAWVSGAAMATGTPCAPGQHGFIGHGDGQTVDQAIIICGARDERDGVSAESAFLRVTFPGYKFLSQSLTTVEGGVYDKYSIQLASGQKRIVFFNITDFFGKRNQ